MFGWIWRVEVWDRANCVQPEIWWQRILKLHDRCSYGGQCPVNTLHQTGKWEWNFVLHFWAWEWDWKLFHWTICWWHIWSVSQRRINPINCSVSCDKMVENCWLSFFRGAVKISLDMWIRITVVVRDGKITFTISGDDSTFPIDQGLADLLTSDVRYLLLWWVTIHNVNISLRCPLQIHCILGGFPLHLICRKLQTLTSLDAFANR